MPTTPAVHGPAIRATFLLAFDNFSTDPSEVATLPEVGNVRYARELLALLEQAGLVSSQDVNGDEIVWQVANPGTYDSATRKEAEVVIDNYLSRFDGQVAKPVGGKRGANQRKAATSASGVTKCLCGCGLLVGGRAAYRPGHDARHASQIARTILAMTGSAAENAAHGADLMKNLSPALAAKVLAQVKRDNDKTRVAQVKSGKRPTPKAEPKVTEGTVKVGRWTYPAQSFKMAGKQRMNINDCRDGSGDWLDAEQYNNKPQSYWLERFVAN